MSTFSRFIKEASGLKGGFGGNIKNLARLREYFGRARKQEPFYREFLGALEDALGPRHPGVAAALDELGRFFQSQGRYPEALPLLQRALDIREKSLGPGHEHVAHSLDSLALLYQSQGFYADAEPLLRRALAIREKTLGFEHGELAESLSKLALYYGCQGRYVEAEQYLNRAAAVWKGFERRQTQRTLYQIFVQNKAEDIYKWHHYFDIYDQFLSRFRGQPVTVLEIGVLHGGSLRMWREYFGGAAKMFAIDRDPECARYEAYGARIFIGDQADRSFLKKVIAEAGEFDVVIDDGGHRASHQIHSFEELYPATKQIYIVEDTHTSYWQDFMDMGEATFIKFAKEKIDLLHEWHKDQEKCDKIYNTPPSKRTEEPPVSKFCKTTLGIHFFDSIVVFKKGENMPRWHEYR